MRRRACRDVLGSAAGNQFPAFVASLGTQVNDVVGSLDHVKVMLDDDNRMAVIDQAVQTPKQPIDVGKVQAGGRFVQDVQGVVSAFQLAEARRRA